MKYSRLSSTSATIQWDSLPDSDRNGKLTEYTVILKKHGVESRTKCPPQETEYTFPILKRYTAYSVEVSAKTCPANKPVNFSTNLFGKQRIGYP